MSVFVSALCEVYKSSINVYFKVFKVAEICMCVCAHERATGALLVDQ